MSHDLGLSVLDLGPMYATDRRQTDRRQTASSLKRGIIRKKVANKQIDIREVKYVVLGKVTNKA